jgi:hypothetical protein
MPRIPRGRGGGKPRLRIQDILTHLAEYHAETSPIERLVCERAFPEWFRYFAECGCPLAKELLADPNWMRRFPVLTFNNTGDIDLDFIRSRLAVPAHLTDERDIFWRVRTNAVGEVGQYLDAAYDKAVTWDSDAERDILIDAIMTVAKRRDWSASMLRENAKLTAAGPHAIGSAARYALTHREGLTSNTCERMHGRLYAILEVAEALEGRPFGDAHRCGPPLPLDVLFKQAPEAELYFRHRARCPPSPPATGRTGGRDDA